MSAHDTKEGRDYAARLTAERAAYRDNVSVHDLPRVFHYWSNEFVRPKLRPFGFSDDNDLFKTSLEQCAPHGGAPQRFLSIGAGNCDLEIEVALHLQAKGRTDFVIDCVDLNADMLGRGASAAVRHGVGDRIHTIQADCNLWTPAREYDAAMANQALHHVVQLEHLFTGIGSSLKPEGRFIVSDIVGRNGHQRWPEALAVTQEFWRKLPPSYRFNWRTGRYEEMFEDYDCSQEGFEAIRSQDILPLLLDRFHFHMFLGFANVIEPFVDRSFGHNFDVTSEWDRAFIEAVHRRDEEEIASGRIKPTHMLAVLGKQPPPRLIFEEPLSPQFCVRSPDLHRVSGPPSRHAYDWGAWPHGPQPELEIACRRLADAASRIKDLKRELDSADRRGTHMKKELDEAYALSEERTKWAERLDIEVKALSALADERSRWALRLNTEVEQTYALVDQRTAWALQLQGELDERAARVRALEAELKRLGWARRLHRYGGRLLSMARRVFWRRAPCAERDAPRS